MVDDAEEVDPVEQRWHLPAGDRQAARLAEGRRHVGAVSGDDVALGRTPLFDELADDLAAAIEKALVEGTHGIESGLELVVDEVPSVLALGQFVHGVHGVPEPQLVQALEVARAGGRARCGQLRARCRARRCLRHARTSAG